MVSWSSGPVLVDMTADYLEETWHFGNSTSAWQLNSFLSPGELLTVSFLVSCPVGTLRLGLEWPL